MTYKIQEEFVQQGYFSVRATPMGANLVLLENLEEGEMEALLEGAQDWLATWFLDIRKWSPGEVDDECLTWVKCYRVPAHTWRSGESVKIDENTEKKKKTLDVAKILIRRKRYDAINFVERFEINGKLFVIKVVEDWFAPQWYTWNRPKEESASSSSNSLGDESGECDECGEDEEIEGEILSSEEEATEGVIGEGEKSNVSPMDEGYSGDQQAGSMMRSLGNTKAAHDANASMTATSSNESLIMGSVGDCGGTANTNINLITTVIGKCEKAIFENCKSVEVTVNEGKITYNPPPSGPVSQVQPTNPTKKIIAIEPSPDAHSARITPLEPETFGSPNNSLVSRLANDSSPSLPVSHPPPSHEPSSARSISTEDGVASPPNLTLVVDLPP